MEKLTTVIVTALISCIITYSFCHSGNSKTETTYNSTGVKTVVSYCQREIDCNIAIGKECSEDGFTVVNEDHFDQKIVITASCGKKKE